MMMVCLQWTNAFGIKPRLNFAAKDIRD